MVESFDIPASDAGTGPLPDDLGFGFMFDRLPDGVVVVDTLGRIVLVNAAALTIFGYSLDELRGRPVAMLLPERFRENHSYHRAAFHRDPKMRPMGAGLELFGLRKGGAEFPVEISLSPSGSGSEMLVTAIVRDITERKTAEAEQARLLHEAESARAQFRDLLESAPDAVVTVGRDARIVLVNHQTEILFGYRRDDLQGQPIEILIPERFHDDHVRHRSGYIAEPRTRPMGVGLELFGRRADGSEFPVEISLSPMQSDDGDLLITAIVRDITDRKEIEIQSRQAAAALAQRSIELEAANRELASFAYSVSHDLRAPLRSIDGFSLALLEDYGEAIDERGLRNLTHVREAAQEMGQLIEDMLHLSRVTRGELRRDQVDLSALARAIAESLARGDGSRDVEWAIADGLDVEGDERLLRVLIENLLGNAWKFSRDRSPARIEVGCVNREPPVYFVRDNGAGFDMRYIDKLFGPFQRLHSVTEFEGTGIGLATAQRIVHRHGGRIWAEGMVDQGATFSFTLPKQEEALVTQEG